MLLFGQPKKQSTMIKENPNNLAISLLSLEGYKKFSHLFPESTFTSEAKRVYLDGQDKLKFDSILYAEVIDGANYLRLKVKGETHLCEDVISDDQLEEVNEEQRLPSINLSKVSRKLSELGISGPFTFIGILNSATYDISKHLYKLLSRRIYIDEISLPNGKTEYQIRVYHDKGKYFADEILEDIMSRRQQTIVRPEPIMVRFHEAIEQIAK